MHILLVEDSEFDARLAQRLLHDLGTVEWVRSLEEAKAALQRQKWDVVLADLDLGEDHPIEDTIRVLTVLTSATPVIAHTAHDRLFQQMPSLGEWDGFISKGSLSTADFRAEVSRAAQVKISREAVRLMQAINDTLDTFLAATA